MLQTAFGLLESVQRELLLFCGAWFLLGAIDDVAIDLMWIVRTLRAKLTGRTPPHERRLCDIEAPSRPGPIALFVPAWAEADVICAMLTECGRRWRGCRYRIHVGCYPNDPATIAAVKRAMRADPAIRLAIHRHPGPTTKADCLNLLWRALLEEEEAKGGETAKAVVLHDAEDLVDPDELRVFDALIERHDLVQLPVRPLRVPGSPFVSGHYCDEFAEAHGKQLVVREWLGAGLPSAGVGCAFSPAVLRRVAQANGGLPFSADSLTEDYELGLKIKALGASATFARVRREDGTLVATRSCFPATLDQSVRQKTRWLTGIALAGWDRLGWSLRPAEFWMRLRDRRATVSALVLFAAYITIVLTGILLVAAATGAYRADSLSEPLLALLSANLALFGWRLAIRAWFTWRDYGAPDAWLSVPRAFVSNYIAILAARRAVWAYLIHCLGKPLTWDKTDHRFPLSHERSDD